MAPAAPASPGHGAQVQQLEDRQPRRRGKRAGVDVLCVRRPVQGGLRGAPVDFRQRVLEQLNGGQDLKQPPEGSSLGLRAD